MNKLIHIIALTLLIGCATTRTTNEFRTGVLAIEFCELPEHVGELVYIECTYSGVEEYWSLNGKQDCNPQLETELEFSEKFEPFPNRISKNLTEVHNNYWNTFLELKLVGRFDNTEPGYGHLGSNNAKFTIEEVVSIKTVKKQNPDKH